MRTVRIQWAAQTNPSTNLANVVPHNASKPCMMHDLTTAKGCKRVAQRFWFTPPPHNKPPQFPWHLSVTSGQGEAGLCVPRE
mgnify:CR=1 FL=1